jgi:hypothetical protein
MTRKSGRNTDGTFGPGNSGKPKGTRLYSLSLLIPQETDMLNKSLKVLHAV